MCFIWRRIKSYRVLLNKWGRAFTKWHESVVQSRYVPSGLGWSGSVGGFSLASQNKQTKHLVQDGRPRISPPYLSNKLSGPLRGGVWNDTICIGLEIRPHLDLSRVCVLTNGCYGNKMWFCGELLNTHIQRCPQMRWNLSGIVCVSESCRSVRSQSGKQILHYSSVLRDPPSTPMATEWQFVVITLRKDIQLMKRTKAIAPKILQQLWEPND